MTSRRMMITGASGLLGRALYRQFSADPAWETLGLAFNRAKGHLRKVDLTSQQQVQTVIQDFKPTVIIHSAAERRPDIVETQEDQAIALNVTSTQYLCQEAAKVGAYVIYVSTDYVFDGTQPPYKVDDAPNPINKYGRSKLDGEKVAITSSKENIIFRVSILYGDVEYLEESGVTLLFPKVKDIHNDCVMSDYERRFPTLTDDVAAVLQQLVEKRLSDPSLTGVFHWSSREIMTKYDMAVTMATVFGLPTSHIKADGTPSSGAVRPYNVDLDCSRLEDLGICRRTPYKEAVKHCLSPFFEKKPE